MALFPLVRLLRHIAAFLLVALWLPATQHCLLAAVELVAECHAGETGCCDKSDTGCDASTCSVLEGGSYRPSTASVPVPQPELLTGTCLICFQPEPSLLLAAMESRVGCDSFERPPDCSPTWHFVQRAALSPRAPSCAEA